MKKKYAMVEVDILVSLKKNKRETVREILDILYHERDVDNAIAEIERIIR